MSVKIIRTTKVETGFPPIERHVVDLECTGCHRQHAALVTLGGADQTKDHLIAQLVRHLRHSPCPCSFEVL